MPVKAHPVAASKPVPPAAPVAGWVEVHPRFRQRLIKFGLMHEAGGAFAGVGPASRAGRARRAGRVPDIPERSDPGSRAARLASPTPADALLALPGEVVSGHPDRHVMRVELPGWGRALYLKRQHRVTWRERLRQRLAGFGWASRCGREAHILRELEAAGLPFPPWVAHGEDGRGRAFLLVEELADAVELRRLLSDNRLSPADRRRVAEQLGRGVADLHAAGFDTPDLTAKHVFVNPDTFAVTLIDWQSARRVTHLGAADRARSLAALHASLADHLATSSERRRFLRAYGKHSACERGSASASGDREVAGAPAGAPATSRSPLARITALAKQIESLAARQRGRRSVRDQRQAVGAAVEQRLVWLAGEAVCAVPAVAAVWPTPAVAPPFYDGAPAGGRAVRVRLPDGRAAGLVRGHCVTPVARLKARLRGRPWRSPGVTLGRVLFHLQRYGLPAPQLFAFGQRETGPSTADWFALHEPPAGRPLADWPRTTAPASLRREVFAQVGLLLRQLHDAGCRYTGRGPLFWVAADPAGRVSVGGVRAVRVVRRVTPADRRADLLAVLGSLPGATRADRLRAVRGYHGAQWRADPHSRKTGRLALAGRGRA